MKKLIAIVLVLAMCLPLCACGTDDGGKNNGKDDNGGYVSKGDTIDKKEDDTATKPSLTDISIKIHYYREDGAYDEWGFWIWEQNGAAGNLYSMEEKDGFGGVMVCKLSGFSSDILENGIGFIPRRLDEWIKDGEEDRLICFNELELDENSCYHVYIVQGDSDIYTEPTVHIHSYVPELMVEATCEACGKIKYTCKDCGKFYIEETSALGHDTNGGDTCSRCGKIILSMTPEEKENAINMEYMGDRNIWHQDNKGRYVLVFSLKDSDYNCLKIPCVVTIYIKNDNGEIVYEATKAVKSSWYLDWTYNNGTVTKTQASIYIYDNELETGSCSEGDIYFTVENSGYFTFSESSLSISGLPTDKNENADISSVLSDPLDSLAEIKSFVSSYYTGDCYSGGNFRLIFNSVDGVYLSWGATNLSDKEIKYITFTIDYYNRVGDPAYDSITKKSSCTARLTGPIGAGKSFYMRELIGYGSDIYYGVISNIKIEYMDGTAIEGACNYTTWHNSRSSGSPKECFVIEK